MVNEKPRLNKGLARDGAIGYKLLEDWLSAVPQFDCGQQATNTIKLLAAYEAASSQIPEHRRGRTRCRT